MDKREGAGLKILNYIPTLYYYVSDSNGQMQTQQSLDAQLLRSDANSMILFVMITDALALTFESGKITWD
jgi:hypothetical protein